MSAQPKAAPLTPTPVDPFVYRMLAGIVLGASILNFGFAANLHLQRIPNLQRVIESVKLDNIGRGGEWLLEKHFLLLPAAGIAVGVSIGAFWKLGRSQLVLAYLINFVSIAMTLAAEVANTRVWTRVLSKVLQ